MIDKISERFLELGIEIDKNSPDMVAYWDQNLICRYANEAYLQWFGVSPGLMIDKMPIQRLLGSLYIQNLPFIEGALKGQVQIFERDIPTAFGEVRRSIATYCPAYAGEQIIGFYVHVADVTPRKESSLNSAKRQDNNWGPQHAKDPVDEIRQTLERSLLEEFPGVNQIARAHYISESNLKRGFRSRYNKGIFAYYRFKQMELAENYLKDKKQTKKQVAAILHFTNATNFIICYQKYLREKASQKVIDELTRANDDRYKTFITQTPFAIAMLDTELVFRAASQKYIDDYHLHFKPIFGANYYTVFPEVNQKWSKIHKSALRGKQFNGEEHIFERENGSYIWIRWDIRPWRNAKGEIGGILIYTEDITAVKLKDQEKDKILEIMNKATELTRIGAWKKNFSNNTGYWSDKAREILEVPKQREPTSDLDMEFYKMGESRNNMMLALKSAIEFGKPFDVSAEVITARGNQKFVRVVGYPEFRNGKCERLFGIYQEIGKFNSI